MAVAPGPASVGAAWLDATTGEFVVAEWDGSLRWDRLQDEMGATRPREILVPAGAPLPDWLADPRAEAAIPRTELPEADFDARNGRRDLLAHFGVLTLEAFGCESLPRATAAGAAVLRYVRDTQRRDLAHLTSLRTRASEEGLVLDALTRRNLELVENLADGCPPGDPARRPRPHPHRHGRAPPARMDPAPSHRDGAHPRPPGRGRGDGLPDPRAGAAPRALRRRPGPRPHPGPGQPGHGQPTRPGRHGALVARPALRGRVPWRRRRRHSCAARSHASIRPSTSPPPSSPCSWTTRPPPPARAGSCATASTRSSTTCARSAAAGARPSPPSRSASAPAPASAPSRSASTACSATTSRSASRTSAWCRRTTFASRPSRAASASSPPSSRSTRRRS